MNEKNKFISLLIITVMLLAFIAADGAGGIAYHIGRTNAESVHRRTYADVGRHAGDDIHC